MNLGAVIRSAYFLGADVVLTSADYPSAPLTPVVSKASAGAMEVFPPKAVYQDIFV